MEITDRIVTEIQENKEKPGRLLIRTLVGSKKHQTDLIQPDHMNRSQFKKEALTLHLKYLIKQVGTE